MSITQRIDAVTGIPDSHRREVCPPPRSCKFELTSRCQYRCSFCVKSIREDSQDMRREDFSRWAREIHDAGVIEAGLFFLGESMLCPWLPEAVAECREIGYEYIFLTTNGAACTYEKLDACMAAGLDSLKFSLNFSDRYQLAKIAQVSPKNFERAISAVKMAREIRDSNGYQTQIYASSIKFDGEQGEKMAAVLSEVEPYCDQTYWLPLYGMSGASKAHGMKPQPGNPGRLAAMRDPVPCWSLFTETRVTRDGLVAGCCFGSGLDGSLIMGDLKKHPFMEIWNGEKYRTLRRAHLAKDVSRTACASCAAA